MSMSDFAAAIRRDQWILKTTILNRNYGFTITPGTN